MTLEIEVQIRRALRDKALEKLVFVLHGGDPKYTESGIKMSKRFPNTEDGHYYLELAIEELETKTIRKLRDIGASGINIRLKDRK